MTSPEENVTVTDVSNPPGGEDDTKAEAPSDSQVGEEGKNENGVEEKISDAASAGKRSIAFVGEGGVEGSEELGDGIAPMDVDVTEEFEGGVTDEPKATKLADGCSVPTQRQQPPDEERRKAPRDNDPETTPSESDQPGTSKTIESVVLEEESDQNEGDVFSALGKRKIDLITPSRKPRKKRPKIEIKLRRIKKQSSSNIISEDSDDDDSSFHAVSAFQSEIISESEHFSDALHFDNAAEEALERALAFYAETHEDQDPRVQALVKDKEKRTCQKELDTLVLEDEAGRKEIKTIVQTQLKEKQASADRNIERLRSKAIAEEQKDLQKLLQIYNEKAASNLSKIQTGIKLFSRRHTSEMQKQAQQHRLTAQQRGMPEQMANAEWARISAQIQEKQRRQLQEFNAKGDEVKKKCEDDYLREHDKRRKHHEKRKKDMETGMRKFITRMHQNFQQQHQRYLKRHIQRINNKKNEILARMNGLPPPSDNDANPLKDVFPSEKEERQELRAPRPIRYDSFVSKDAEEVDEKSAAARHKHRKAILSTIPKQLGVEIHNEGLWIAPITDDKESKEKDSSKSGGKQDDAEFIPWGLKAREVLHAIVCGEIPLGYGPDRFDLSDVLAGQGGCVRCVVTDLRTGETTASQQRAECTKEQENEGLQELEKKVAELTSATTKADKDVQQAEQQETECTATMEKTLKEVDKAKKLLQEFKTKFGRFFGPDGQALTTPNPNDQQKLAGASHRYKSNIETAENKEKAAQKAAADAKANTLKLQGIAKQAQKVAAAASTNLRKRKAMVQDKSKLGKQRLSESAESERASARVSDVIGALKKTADRRREQLSQKRSSSASSTWVQGLPGVPGPLKKSLWHKMHRRRRQQIVLRPPIDYMVDELKSKVAEEFNSSKGMRDSTKEDPVVRAERLFLLAVHPEAPPGGQLSRVPSTATNDPWAEPGWHLNLEVTEEDRSNFLLPRTPVSALFENNHIEVCSAPGRQAASFLRVNHTKALSAPLSTVAQAISLAEINPLITGDTVYSESDPLNISHEAMMSGYQFSVKAAAKAAAAPRRKSAVKSDGDSVGDSSTTTKKSLEDTAPPKASRSQQHISKARSSIVRKSPSIAAPGANQLQAARRAPVKAEKGRRRVSKKQEHNTHVIPRMQPMEHKGQVGQTTQMPQQVVPQQSPQQVAQATMLQQQALGMRYQQQASVQQSMDPQQQFGQQFMNQVSAVPHVAAPVQHGGHSGHGLPQLQPQPMQQTMNPQQHLLPQPPQQYASPQQQAYQRQQMAQMRLMQQQQQQQQSRQGYPQGQQMQFFPPAMAQRQGSFAAHMPRGVAPPGVLQHPSQARRSTQQGQGDDQNDPLLMLNDMNGP